MKEIHNRRNITETLSIQPWFPLKCSDSSEVLFKKLFEPRYGCLYAVLCYDSYALWKESVDEEMVLKKCKHFNENIEASSSQILTYLKNGFENCSNFTKNKSLDNETLELSLKFKVQGGVPFRWSFVMQREDHDSLQRELFNPLFSMVTELFRRQEEMSQLLLQKDRQIEDYKLQGHQVSRKYLETLPYDQTFFQDTANLNKDFISSCGDSSCYSSVNTPGFSQLYRNIMINKSCSQTASIADVVRAPTFDTVDQIPTEGPSWNETGRLPASAAFDQVGGEKLSPLKDVEQDRRDALKRRLEDEAVRKNKKKKKKITF